MKDKSISWQAPEHEHTEKGSDWFIALGIISISIAVVAILFHNTAFAGLIIIAAITFTLFANTKPKEITFSLTETGVVVGEVIYLYTEIDGFWIEDRYYEDDIEDTLILNIGKILTPLLVISIPDTVNSEKIRSHLGQYLKETELHEPLLQKLVEAVAL
jgi:hypothetical protein